MASPQSFARKLLLGLSIAAVLSGLLLGALELGLRVAGVGHDAQLQRTVRAAEGGRVYRENRWVTAPYFPSELVRRPQAFRLPEPKSPAAYRIFVLGSSAAMGDPEPSFSIARMLERMLAAAYPEIHFEVVNAGITAINSHVVRHLAADAAELAPDLFVVYEGHNEVIGPYGPGTVFTPFLGSPGAIRLVDTVRRLRVGQWFNDWRHRQEAGSAEWGGMTMFLEQQVAATDPRLDPMRRAFQANLKSIAAAAEAAGAHVLLCTVLTNQRDFAPFLSLHRADLSAPERAEWEALVEAGHAEVAAGRITDAERFYRRALTIDDTHADLTFRLARLVLGQRRSEEARGLFQKALDLDALRFRADSELNRIIRAMETPGVEVVDLEAAAAAASAGGIIGNELLLEHVHLTFAGTYLVARELFHRVGDDLLRRGRTPIAVREVLTMEDLRVRLGYTTYEQAMIVRELLDRYSRPPFTGQSDQAQRVQALQETEAAAARLLSRPEAKPALKVLYEQALAQAPDDWVLARNAGMALVALGDEEAALPWLERAQRQIDDDPPTLHAYGLALRALGREDEAEKAFARLRALEPRYPGLPVADEAPR